MGRGKFSQTTVLLFAVLFSALSLAADPQAIRYYEDAVARFNAGDAKGALVQLKNSLQRDPAQLPAKILLGRTHLALGDPLAAEEELTQALRLGADPLLLALPLAEARNQLGKFQLNIDALRPTDAPPDVASDLWVQLGTARLGSGDAVGAEIAFNEALKLRPEHGGAILGLASTYITRGEFERAEPLCAQALAVAPDNADAWFMMGALMQARDQLEGAEAHHRRALQLDPGHPRAALAQAIVVLKRGRGAEAAELFQAILEKRPWSLEAAYLRSQALTLSDQPTQAAEALQYAADLVSKVTPLDLAGNPTLLRLSALTMFESGQYETAFGFLDGYLKYRPDDLLMRKRLAQLLMQLDKPLDALRELRSLANIYPKDAETQIMLGDLHVLLKDFATAEQHYAVALDLTTADTMLISKLGYAQRGQGRTDRAIETMQRLVELAPAPSGGASVFLAILLIDRGELEAARRVADTIAEQQPDNLLASNLQGVIAVAQGQRERGRGLLVATLQKDPNFAPARINLVKLDILEGRYDTAGAALDRLLAAKADDVNALRTYAELYLAQLNPREAIKSLERIRAANPGSVRDVLELARLYDKTGRRDDALATLLALDKTVPGETVVKLRLAEMRMSQGDTDEARSVLLDAAQLAGSNLAPRLAVSDMQIKAGAYDDAAQGLQRLITAYPEEPGPPLLMARLRAEQRRLIQADDIASSVLQSHPDSLAALALLGDIRLARGQSDEAVSLYRRAAAIRDAAQLAISLHHALVAGGKDAQALQELADWDRKNPGDQAVMGVLADHYLRIGQRQQAITLYRRLIELNAENVEAYNNLAVALMELDIEGALKAGLRAYELAPTNPAVLDTVGWILVQVGDLDTGLARLREAVVRNGRSPEIRYHLAVALEEYGNQAAAIRELRQALSSDARFAERDEAELRLKRLELLFTPGAPTGRQ